MNSSRSWLLLIGSSVLQVVLYHLGIILSAFFLLSQWGSVVQAPIYCCFMLIPLQRLLIRRGKREFLFSMVLSFLIIAALRFYVASLLTNGSFETSAAAITFPSEMRGIVAPLIIVELMTLVCLIAGLVVMNTDFETLRGSVRKLLLVTGFAGVVGLILIVVLAGNTAFLTGMKSLFTTLMAQLQEAAGMASVSFLPGDLEILNAGIWQYVLGGLLLGYFINLSVSYYGGIVLAGKSSARYVKPPKLEFFHVPDQYIWPLIVSWAIVLLNRFLSLQEIEIFGQLDLLVVVETFARNTGLIFLFLYGLQGLSILRFMARKYNLFRRWNFLLIIVILAVLLVRPLAIAVAVLVPGLGVSEIWIKYRKKGKESSDNEDNS